MESSTNAPTKKPRRAHAVFYYRAGLPAVLLSAVWIVSSLVPGVVSEVVAVLLIGGLIYGTPRVPVGSLTPLT